MDVTLPSVGPSNIVSLGVSRVAAVFVSLLGPLVVGACADTGTAGTAAIRDSAGVSIVEYGAVPAGDTLWISTESASVSIGVLSGPSELEFNRITGALIMEDDRIVIGDAGSDELRLFSVDGRHLATAGGQGQGPGEFGALMGIWRGRADTVLAWDGSLRRLSVWQIEASGIRHVSDVRVTERFPNRPEGVGPVGDGGFVLMDQQFVIPNTGFAAQEARFVTLARGTGATAEVLSVVSGAMGALEQTGVVSDSLFSAPLTYAVWQGGIAVARGDGPEMRFYDESGRLVRILRWGEAPEPIPGELVEQIRASELEGLEPGPQRERVERYHVERPVAEFLPFYDEAIIDAGGRTWLKRFLPFGEGDPLQQWIVFEPNGSYFGDVLIPANVRPLYITAEEMLAVEIDEFDVERLVRIAPASPR